MTRTLARTLAASAVVLLCGAAQAEGPFNHPALRSAAAVESGTQQASAAAPMLIGHPASPRWAAAPAPAHANGEHPAVRVARRAGTEIDANTFIVQPPATAQWRRTDDAPIAVATAPAVR